MATEIVIVGDEPITREHLLAVGALHLPEGLALEMGDGEMSVLLDAAGDRVLTAFASARIEVTADVEAMLGPDGPRGSWWTSVVLPFGEPEPGTSIATMVAGAAGSTATVLR